MKRAMCLSLLLVAALGNALGAVPADKVHLELMRVAKNTGQLHWKITNDSTEGVYVYNFFMLGPAYNIERSPGKLVFDTSPTVRVASCPPNRVAPLLLTFVRSGGVIEGDFMDDELKQAGGAEVSLKVAVGSEPYKVVEEAKRFYNSNCKHSPYDAIINWATFLQSNSVKVP
jgi:hypothetical protein